MSATAEPRAAAPGLFAFDDAALARLAERHGTPCFVYRAAVAERAFTGLRAALLPGVRVAYAVKANPHPVLLERLARLGASFDCASAGELRRAAAALPISEPHLDSTCQVRRRLRRQRRPRVARREPRQRQSRVVVGARGRREQQRQGNRRECSAHPDVGNLDPRPTGRPRGDPALRAQMRAEAAEAIRYARTRGVEVRFKAVQR